MLPGRGIFKWLYQVYSVDLSAVKKGWGDEVIKASRKAGACGGTIVFGRGTGIHENKSIFGLMIEPEKEIVLTKAQSPIADNIVESIT